MKNFFRLSVLKIVITLVILFTLVPFIKIDLIVSPCQIPPCPELSSINGLMAVLYWDNYEPTGINWLILLLGAAASYLVVCLIAFLNKRDFMVVVSTILLQVGTLLAISAIHISSEVQENMIGFVILFLLSLAGFWFFGKRKRTLVFTMVLPLMFLFALIMGGNLI